MHNNVTVVIRRLLSRSSPSNSTDFCRALIENVADSDGDVNTVTLVSWRIPSDRFVAVVTLPRRGGFYAVGSADAYAYDTRAAVFAEGRGEASGHSARFAAAGGQLVRARGDV